LGLNDPIETQAFICCAKKKAKRVLENNDSEILNADEIAAINLYTQETPLYGKLNHLLRERNRTALRPAFPFLRLLLNALHKLDYSCETVFRGVKCDLKGRYLPEGKDIVWWSFSSCTDDAKVLSNDLFLGTVGQRTMFSIKANVVNIKRYSSINEGEHLLLPGRQLVIKGQLFLGSGLTMIQLEERMVEDSLLVGFSFASQSQSKPKILPLNDPPNSTLSEKPQESLNLELQPQQTTSKPQSNLKPSVSPTKTKSQPKTHAPQPKIQFQPFICSWEVDSSDLKITLPLVSDGRYDFHVEWGDNTSDNITSHEQGMHLYASPGTYVVKIMGEIDGFCFAFGEECKKIRNVSQWGCLLVGKDRGQWFAGCEHLTCTATDTLDMTGVKNAEGMFSGCHAINCDMSTWDMSKVSNMDFMFRDAHAFNDDISTWDTSNVTSMEGMFENALSFNGDISGWDVSNVTSIRTVFRNTHAFNNEIGNWDVRMVTDMEGMFCDAVAFNNDLSHWETSNVTNMKSMFEGAIDFNGDLSMWNTSQVTSMEQMFKYAHTFNKDISGWDTSNVINMYQMFYGAKSFNSDISNWDTSKVNDIRDMFHDAENFSSDVSKWQVNKLK